MVCFEWLGAFSAILSWVDRNFADGRPVLGDKSEKRFARSPCLRAILWQLLVVAGRNNPWPILTVVLRYWTRTRTPP
jgi:hypothetical protein